MLVWLSIVVIVAGLSSFFFDIGFWIASVIVAVALFINGLVAEVEDRGPGGFLNPKEDD